MSEQSEKSCADCRIIGSSRCYLVCDNLSLYEPTEKPNRELGHCKNCDMWKRGKTGNNDDWYSDEGFCTNWREMTGEDFYCADFIKGGNDYENTNDGHS